MDRVIEKKNRFFNKRNIGIIIAAILVLFVGYNMIFGDTSSKLNIEQEKITIETIEEGEFKDYIAVIGTVEPIKTIFLDAVEGGRVEEIIIEEGNMVEKGEEIMKLSSTDLILRISDYEAQAARSINQLREARMSMQRDKISKQEQMIELNRALRQHERAFLNNQKLYQNNHISEEDFLQSKENYEATQNKLALVKEAYRQDSIFRKAQISSLEQSVQRMEEGLDIVREKLENLTVKAPVNGELATLVPEIGEVITYGTRIGKINVLDNYKLNVEIDEHYIARVRRGLQGSFNYTGKNFSLNLTKKYPEVKQGKFTVDMVFRDEKPEDINIGQTFRIKLELGQSKTAILIPRGGFYQSTGGQWVYVVDPAGDFAYQRDIRIGRQNPKYYEVLEGLQPGEKVIVSSYDNFNEVDKLMIK